MSIPNTSGSASPASPPEPDLKTVRKAVAASALGNATEWFDYGLYAVSVTYLAQHFFPGEHAQLMALLTFAVSFIFRPLGGIVWGPMGDRLGRKRVLALTILLMAGSTFCIALLPSYATIGVAAPIILVLLRIIQGFSSGGEYGGAATFMAEYAPDNRRGFFGSFLEFGTLAGMAAGSLFVLLLQLGLGEQTMTDWAWRIPFIFAGVLGVVGLYLRSRLDESPVYEELDDGGQDKSVKEVFATLFANYKKQLLVLGGMVVAVNVVNYTLLSYMPTYLQDPVGMSPNASLTVMFLAQAFMMILIPFGGMLSDKVGRKPVWYFSLISLFVAAIPMFMLMANGFVWALIGLAVLGILYIPQISTISATFPAMFPGPVRFAGFAISYNVSTALFGGTAPSISDGLIGATGNNIIPAYLVMAACAIGLIATIFMKETNGASLRGCGLPETGADVVLDEADLVDNAK
ncbi:MFS transporter, MHS family, proline/betaine transporter [Brevibacterium siliguriense]|uniref:Putative proline/betaine transporter n=1 Tax=Brevibacterium siliguriense TaxID=1136497 RepID=A0A1H1W4W5_9MICO|nr:MFS transporter [Brevibacterium siliguriense]SDS92095.1 MFS transporter, MHS family, proline/betaine transporter [Brevibacterium siliguriense]